MARCTRSFCACCLLALCCGDPFGAVDLAESLVDRLEAAATGREKHDTLDEILRRHAEEPLTAALTERLVAELMSDESYNSHQMMAALPKLAGDRGFSEQSLIALARGLSGKVTQSYLSATAIADALSPVQAGPGLPDAAFSALIEALGHPAMLNRSAAIDVLAATRDSDDCHATVVNALLVVLNTNDHEHTRGRAIAGLARLNAGRPFPAIVIDSVVHTATSDPYMTVRMAALEALAEQDIDLQRRRTLSASLAAEIVTPTAELWNRSRGLDEHRGLGDRATAVLQKLHDPPYPAQVIDAWIAQTRGHLPEKSLMALRPVHLHGELSDAQIAELVRVAETQRLPIDREMIYRVLFDGLGDGALAEALVVFERGDDEPRSVRSGYEIKEQYRGKAVPDEIADVAARVALSGGNEEMRGIAASLLSHAVKNRALRESQLISALASHADDNGIQNAIIDSYGSDRLYELIVKYAADPAISVSFRHRIIREFGKRKSMNSNGEIVGEARLSAELENTLKAVARYADDYYLIQAAGDTLEAWGIRPPLRVSLKKRENQSKALFVLLIGMVIVNLVASLNALMHLCTLPLRTEAAGKRKVVRSAMLVGWLALFLGMAALLAVGLIGFIGHNSAPKPVDTMMLNVPAYLGTMTYVAIAWLLRRRARAGAAARSAEKRVGQQRVSSAQ